MNFYGYNILLHHHGSGHGEGNGFLIILEDCEAITISVNQDNIPAGKDELDIIISLMEAQKNLPPKIKRAGNILYLAQNEVFIKIEGAKYPPALDQKEPATLCPN